jgi:hypothetical protein
MVFIDIDSTGRFLVVGMREKSAFENGERVVSSAVPKSRFDFKRAPGELRKEPCTATQNVSMLISE